jgi:carboxypeptidase C (cathepsin A)
MIWTNPDKYIRKAVYDLINGIVVNGKDIKCYDTQQTGNEPIQQYVLLTNQTKEIDKATKCGYNWTTSLLIEIYTKTPSNGNSGSRLLVNDIEQAIYTLINPSLTIENFENQTQNVTFETQLETITTTEIVFRSFIRLNLTLI